MQGRHPRSVQVLRGRRAFQHRLPSWPPMWWTLAQWPRAPQRCPKYGSNDTWCMFHWCYSTLAAASRKCTRSTAWANGIVQEYCSNCASSSGQQRITACMPAQVRRFWAANTGAQAVVCVLAAPLPESSGFALTPGRFTLRPAPASGDLPAAEATASLLVYCAITMSSLLG